MPDSSEPESPDSPPPPAYELTDQEFDQKTAAVLQSSQPDRAEFSYLGHVDHLSSGARSWSGGAGGSQLSVESSIGSRNLIVANGTSSYSYVQYRWESRDEKRAMDGTLNEPGQSPSHPRQKERSRWHADVRLAVQNNTETIAGSPLARSGTVSSFVERERTPPPLFESVGPSLDGPPYEPPAGQLILTYTGDDSRPASPLTETYHSRHMSFTPPHSSPVFSRPSPRQRAPLPQPPQVHQPQGLASPSRPRTNLAPVVSLPASRSPQIPSTLPLRVTPSPRPVSVYTPSARLVFDPQTAYARNIGTFAEEPAGQHIDASAFYNSSVSSFVSRIKPPNQRMEADLPRRALPQMRFAQSASGPSSIYTVSQHSQPASSDHQWTNHYMPQPTPLPLPEQSLPRHQPMPQPAITYSSQAGVSALGYPFQQQQHSQSRASLTHLPEQPHSRPW